VLAAITTLIAAIAVRTVRGLLPVVLPAETLRPTVGSVG